MASLDVPCSAPVSFTGEATAVQIQSAIGDVVTGLLGSAQAAPSGTAMSVIGSVGASRTAARADAVGTQLGRDVLFACTAAVIAHMARATWNPEGSQGRAAPFVAGAGGAIGTFGAIGSAGGVGIAGRAGGGVESLEAKPGAVGTAHGDVGLASDLHVSRRDPHAVNSRGLGQIDTGDAPRRAGLRRSEDHRAPGGRTGSVIIGRVEGVPDTPVLEARRHPAVNRYSIP